MKVRHFAHKIIEDKQSEKSFLFWLRFLFAPHTCRAHARGSDPSSAPGCPGPPCRSFANSYSPRILTMPHIFIRKGRLGSIPHFIREMAQWAAASDRIYRTLHRSPSHMVSTMRLHQDCSNDNSKLCIRGEVSIVEPPYTYSAGPIESACTLWNESCRYFEHSSRVSFQLDQTHYAQPPSAIARFSIPISKTEASNHWVRVLGQYTTWLRSTLRAEGVGADIHSCLACATAESAHISIGVAPVVPECCTDEELVDALDFAWVAVGEHAFPDVYINNIDLGPRCVEPKPASKAPRPV